MRSYRVKKIFEFKCIKCEAIHDEYTEYKSSSTCPSCGSVSEKIISAPRVALEGITGSFPGAADAWVKKHKQKLQQEQKRNAA